MKELAAMPENANLFNVDTKGGLGRTKPKYQLKTGSTPQTMEEYKAARAELIKWEKHEI